MAAYCRAQVLLEPEQRRRLQEIARLEGRSVSDVMRTVLDAGLNALSDQAAEKQRAERQAAHERLSAMRRAKPYAYNGDLVAEMRQERDHDLERIWESG